MKFQNFGKLSICLFIVLQICIQFVSAQSNSTAESPDTPSSKDDYTFSAQQVTGTDTNVSNESIGMVASTTMSDSVTNTIDNPITTQQANSVKAQATTEEPAAIQTSEPAPAITTTTEAPVITTTTQPPVTTTEAPVITTTTQQPPVTTTEAPVVTTTTAAPTTTEATTAAPTTTAEQPPSSSDVPPTSSNIAPISSASDTIPSSSNVASPSSASIPVSSASSSPSQSATPSSLPKKDDGSSTNKTGVIAGSVVGAIVGVALIGGLIAWINRHGGCASRSNKRNKDGYTQDDYAIDMQPNDFNRSAVAAAAAAGVGVGAAGATMNSNEPLSPFDNSRHYPANAAYSNDPYGDYHESYSQGGYSQGAYSQEAFNNYGQTDYGYYDPNAVVGAAGAAQGYGLAPAGYDSNRHEIPDNEMYAYNQAYQQPYGNTATPISAGNMSEYASHPSTDKPNARDYGSKPNEM
ncbi:hypothetical protein BD560DRAFT_391957 [Blakeslea trispora]|nr:hypothetical protein BD560DRAFT_391957 [Blakeslea trispora]